MQRPSKVDEVMEDVFMAAATGDESIAELAERLGVSTATISGARRLLVASGRMPKGKPGRRAGRKYPKAENATAPAECLPAAQDADIQALATPRDLAGAEALGLKLLEAMHNQHDDVPTLEVTIESDPEYIPPPSEAEIDRRLEELEAIEAEEVEAEPTSADEANAVAEWAGESADETAYPVEPAPI